MWIVAATAKIKSPMLAYEFVARLATPGAVSKAVLIAVITAETLLGAVMVLLAIRAIHGFLLSLFGLAAACGALWYVQAHAKVGEIIQCGCYGDAFRGSLNEELVRNGAMAGVLVVLIAWGVLQRRTPPTGDASATASRT
jgi:hypothetical protein